MSTVETVTCHPVSAPLHTPFVTALRRTTTVESLLVEVRDTDGVVGYGEAPQVWRVTGESTEGARACVDGPLRDAILHRDPEDLQPLLRRMHDSVVGNRGARCAVDVAMHDLLARRQGVSLQRLLGGTKQHVATDVTLSAGDTAGLVASARERVAEGFTLLKLKVGTGAAADVERVRAVRSAVGSGVRLRVDANQGWSVREAITVIGALEDAGADLELVEQPVSARDVDGLARVTAAVSTPVMADEAVFDLLDLLELIRRRAADLVNVKLAKCGGLGPAVALLAVAGAAGVGTTIGSMLETAVGVGAAAALAAAHGCTTEPDLDAAWWAAEPVVQGGIRYEAGMIVLPEAPGLGVSL
jgi:L-alanine-DL-glutamate epimerase-like enolase superfamily enzyme